jgi:hypothetical protein
MAAYTILYETHHKSNKNYIIDYQRFSIAFFVLFYVPVAPIQISTLLGFAVSNIESAFKYCISLSLLMLA